MGDKKGNVNTGAVVGVLGALVFLIGFCGTVGSFLFAAADDGRGRWTFFYGAIVWGLVQIIWGFVLAIRAKKLRGRAEDEEEENRPSRRRKTVQELPRIPVPVVVGCGVAGRLKGNALDPAAAYSSEWIGDQTGGSGPTVLGGEGGLIIGIIGKRNARDCNGLGLLKHH